MILEENIVANLPAGGKVFPNEFRTNRLYNEEVDLLLKRHAVMLKAIYSRCDVALCVCGAASEKGTRRRLGDRDLWQHACCCRIHANGCLPPLNSCPPFSLASALAGTG